MTPERFQQIEELFFQIEKLPNAEREAMLVATAARDGELADEIARLLEQADAQLALTAIRESLTSDKGGARIVDEPRVERIGHYDLVRELGRGGMGVVYEALQREPVRRRVALKVVKLGMDSREVIARFENERQTLAMMNHPNVASVHDGGTTERGRPYFVMEYVDGPPLTDYCDRHETGIRGRIELFMRVCEAVQHAHQKGVIHRDLKPSNILVEEADGQALPKVIDFGVAKAIEQQPAERTLVTRHGQCVGTPEYMSPEQAEGTGRDVDTRTDVYALGIILYELLTGTLPFESARLRPLSWPEIQRVICRDEPDRPSARLRQMTHCEAKIVNAGASGVRPKASEERLSADIVARQRGTEPRALARRLRGDLDWIVLKCLEKDQARRYESVAALAEDLRRHLNHEPAAAGPPGTGYRVKKYVRRNRGLVIAASLILALLMTATGGMSVLAIWAMNERDKAEGSQGEAERRAAETEKVAEFQAATLERLDVEQMGLTLMSELRRQVEAGLRRGWIVGEDGRMRKRTEEEMATALSGLDASLAPGNPTDLARSILDMNVLRPSVEALDREFVDQPLLDARLRHSIGKIYSNAGMPGAAAAQLRTALEVRRRELGDEHEATWRCMRDYACELREMGDRDLAEQLLRDVLSITRRLHDGRDPDVARCMFDLAKSLFFKGDNIEAEALYRGALEIYRHNYGERHSDTAMCEHALAVLLGVNGEYDEADELGSRALETCRQFADENPMALASSLRRMANQMKRKGDLDEAESLLRQSSEICRAQYGENCYFMALNYRKMAEFRMAREDYEAAESLYRETVKIVRSVYGADSMKAANEAVGMVEVLLKQKKYEEADTLLRQALETTHALYGERHRNVAYVEFWFGRTCYERGDYPTAESHYLSALRATASNPNPWASNYRRSVSQHLLTLYEKWDEAEPTRGYDTKAAEMRAALDEMEPASTAPSTPTETDDRDEL